MDPTSWAASGIAAAEAVAIGALVARRHHHASRGRRLRLALTYQGRDTDDTIDSVEQAPTPEPVDQLDERDERDPTRRIVP
jgi:hypothetical protein